ncbi:hypothetical protein JXC34_03535, partial [Candidatus Woesearchaeota archaeon]|nr:hypothetical protein [Candidatus Woesearchaeota archaeon]
DRIINDVHRENQDDYERMLKDQGLQRAFCLPDPEQMKLLEYEAAIKEMTYKGAIRRVMEYSRIQKLGISNIRDTIEQGIRAGYKYPVIGH